MRTFKRGTHGDEALEELGISKDIKRSVAREVRAIDDENNRGGRGVHAIQSTYRIIAAALGYEVID